MSFYELQCVFVYFLFVEFIIDLVSCFWINCESHILNAQILILLFQGIETFAKITYRVFGSAMDEDGKILIDLSQFRRFSHYRESAGHLPEERLGADITAERVIDILLNLLLISGQPVEGSLHILDGLVV